MHYKLLIHILQFTTHFFLLLTAYLCCIYLCFYFYFLFRNFISISLVDLTELHLILFYILVAMLTNCMDAMRTGALKKKVVCGLPHV